MFTSCEISYDNSRTAGQDQSEHFLAPPAHTFDDAPLAGGDCRTKRMSRRATTAPKRGECATLATVDNGGNGQMSFCYFLTKRHKPPPRLQRQPHHRVCGAGGDDLKYNDGKGRDVYHFAYTL